MSEKVKSLNSILEEVANTDTPKFVGNYKSFLDGIIDASNAVVEYLTVEYSNEKLVNKIFQNKYSVGKCTAKAVKSDKVNHYTLYTMDIEALLNLYMQARIEEEATELVRLWSVDQVNAIIEIYVDMKYTEFNEDQKTLFSRFVAMLVCGSLFGEMTIDKRECKSLYHNLKDTIDSNFITMVRNCYTTIMSL